MKNSYSFSSTQSLSPSPATREMSISGKILENSYLSWRHVTISLMSVYLCLYRLTNYWTSLYAKGICLGHFLNRLTLRLIGNTLSNASAISSYNNWFNLLRLIMTMYRPANYSLNPLWYSHSYSTSFPFNPTYSWLTLSLLYQSLFWPSSISHSVTLWSPFRTISPPT